MSSILGHDVDQYVLHSRSQSGPVCPPFSVTMWTNMSVTRRRQYLNLKTRVTRRTIIIIVQKLIMIVGYIQYVVQRASIATIEI